MEIKHIESVVNGYHIHALAAGDSGTPVILFHGAGLDSAALSWGELLVPLAESGHRVFAPDMLGYGDSDRPDIAYTVANQIDFAFAYVESLGFEQVDLGGISMGGAMSLGITLRRPELVRRLVLLGPYGIQDKAPMHHLSWAMVNVPGLMEKTWQSFAKQSQLTPSALKNVLYHPERVSTPALLAELLVEAKKPQAGMPFTHIQRDDILFTHVKTNFSDRLPDIHQPTLIIHGEHDAGVPLKYAQRAAALLPNGRLEVIEDAGHWVQREKAELVNPLIIDFLRD